MKKVIALILSLALLSTLAFTACDANMGKFYVNYDKQDGSPITTKSQWVRLNESTLVVEPNEPTRNDYTFGGWYKEPTCENKWIFDTDTLKSGDNITLYAKFTTNESPALSSRFYRLQEAYNLELLTFNDLYDAAFYNNGDYSGMPAISRSAFPKNPEFLSAETETKIKQTFLDDYFDVFGKCDFFENGLECEVSHYAFKHYTLDDISISNYCGTYNNAVVVYLKGLYGYTEAEWSETISDITFYYNNGNYLRVWVESSSLPEIPPVQPKKKTEPVIDLDNFKVNLIYLSSIYSYMVYGSDGNFFMVDDWVYVIDGNFLTRMKPDGTDKEVLPDEVNRYWLYEATYYDGWIYFIDNRYMYIDTLPPPGSNENLMRMKPDGTDLQECIKDVYYFEIHGGWIFYQSGWSFYTVKIGDWDAPYVLHQNSEKTFDYNGYEYTQATWVMRTWLIYDKYIFYSIVETYGGAGQYNTKMYRADLNGTNRILLMESEVISYDPNLQLNISCVYDPRFIYDGYLYFSSYQQGVGDIIYRMDLDGSNITTIIEPERYVLLRTLEIRDGWLYYDGSYYIGTTWYTSIRKVRPDGTDDQTVSGFQFGANGGSYVMWQTWTDASEGKVTRNRLFIAPADGEKTIEVFDGKGWESIVGYFVWNGNIYVFVISWR